MTKVVHAPAEMSCAKEKSHDGNPCCQHSNSLFADIHGLADSRDFEMGGSDARDT